MGEQQFIDNLIRNLEKNGYPLKKVSLPLDRLYEAAFEKGLNFNRILESCDRKGIDHEKTATKIIFYPKDLGGRSDTDRKPEVPPDFSAASMAHMVSEAEKMLKNMTPEQVEEIKKMVLGLSDKERQDLIKKAEGLSRGQAAPN